MSKPVDKKNQKVQDLAAEEYNKTWDQEKSYKYLKKSKDPRFGEITLLKNHTTGDVIFVKEKLANSKKEATTDINNLKSRLQMNNPYMMQMIDYSTAIQKSLCSTNYLTRAFFRYPNVDMKRELQDHKKNLTEFSNSDLHRAQQDILQSLEQLHAQGLNHGDIRPEYIGHDKATGNYILLDRFKDPSPLEKVQTDNLINKRDIYMSPELYKKLQGKQKTATYDAQKNDYHQLGLTLLSLGNQDSVQDIYLPNGDISSDKYHGHLNNFKNKYGGDHSLVSSIEQLTHPEEAHRNAVRGGYVSQQNHHIYQATPDNHEIPVQSIPQENTQTYTTYDNSQYTQPQYTYVSQYQQPTEYKQTTYQSTPQEPVNDDDCPYVVSYETDDQGRKVEVRRYKPGRYPNDYNQSQYNVSRSNHQPQETTVQSTYQQTPVQSTYHQTTVNTSQPKVVRTSYTVKRTSYTREPVTTYQNTYQESNYQVQQNEIQQVQHQEPQQVYQPQEVHQEHQEHQEHQVESNGEQRDVEVRRGSTQPPEERKESEPQATHVKKRYIMQDDGTVVEVDPNQA